MSTIESKLEALGLTLPAAVQPPPGVVLPFSWVRVMGDRAYVSGHVPLNADGTIAEPLGKVGADLSLEEGYAAARATALAVLGSLKRELGDLDRVTAWLRLFGMVNTAPDFDRYPLVINGPDHRALRTRPGRSHPLRRRPRRAAVRRPGGDRGRGSDPGLKAGPRRCQRRGKLIASAPLSGTPIQIRNPR